MDRDPRVPMLAVKCKLGELAALVASGSPVIPMVELLNGERPRVLAKLVEAGAALFRAGRPLWIDISWLTAADPLARTHGVFAELEHRIDGQLQGSQSSPDEPLFVPVVPFGVADAELDQLRLFRDAHHGDLGVRVTRGGVDARKLVARLNEIAVRAGAPIEQVHLIIDAGYVPQLDDRLVRAATALANGVAQALPIASVTLLSGSTPKNRAPFDTRFRARVECDLWEAVSAHSSAAIRYGDYGVVHPEPTGGNGGWTPNPYVHYTLGSRSLFVARSVPRHKSPGVYAEKFGEVADELTRRPEFAGPGYSWGDRRFTECRTGGGSHAGSSPGWIAMATSHHLADLEHRPQT